jgi:CxxC motif-containing protein (DUF1111 family)
MLSPRALAPALLALFAFVLLAAMLACAGAGRASVQGAASDEADALSLPRADLTSAQRARFEQGRRLFLRRWSVAPSAFGQWGRGPLSNGEACTDCHAYGGRGRPPMAAAEPLRSGLVRLGVRSAATVLPHPAYGDQLQNQGVLGRVPAEGEAQVDWVEHAVAFADGTVTRLREPRVRLVNLAYGALDAETVAALRVAPPLFGLGLLDAVPRTALEAIARQQAATATPGRVHRMHDGVGRFGHKATQPSLRHQIAMALHADLGVTSSLRPSENCMAAQGECRAFPATGRPEIGDDELDRLEDYLRGIAIPVRRNTADVEVRHGERLFAELGCAACHVPELPLGSERRIGPYSDLLLHDLGPGLADGLPEGDAGPADWRTAPLWGLGLHREAALLHDGRARSLEEAVLWHGGQAQRSRDGFRRLSAADRRALLAFLGSL